MGKKVGGEWKPSSVDITALSPSDFESFGGIEELTDYEIIKPGKTTKRRLDSSPKRPKQKKKHNRSQQTEAVKESNTEECEHLEQDDDAELDMSAWCNLYVPDEIMAALRDLRFQNPTKIQELALPAGIRDHMDVLAAAETGSGKTLAFGIPLITHIKASKERNAENSDSSSSLMGLVLAPTRELSIQVKKHLQDISKYVNVKIVAVVGGLSQEKQRRLLKRRPDIIVATPGRLWQLMEEGEPYLENMPSVRYLVIDEADRMVEQGHFEELSKILELLNKNKKVKRRQNFIFSATLTLVHELPKRLQLKKGQKIVQKNKLESLMKMVGIREKPKIIDITKKRGVVETLSESQIMCKLEEKDMYLYYFKVMHPARTLVFCNSISCVRRLKSVLEHLGCSPLALHASMHQRQRLKNLDMFASSKEGLLLATDVAARGLDIRGIEHVIHFQVPRTAEIYIHRSGRTARAQNEGLSLMLIEPQEVVYYKKICKTLNKDKSLPPFPIDQGVLKAVKERVVLARQIDQFQHREQRLAAQNRWFLKAAEEMEVDVEDEELLNELGDEREQSLKSRQLKAMKKQLKVMLQKPVIPKRFTGSYPTKSGRLSVPERLGSKKAVEVLKKKEPGSISSTACDGRQAKSR